MCVCGGGAVNIGQIRWYNEGRPNRRGGKLLVQEPRQLPWPLAQGQDAWPGGLHLRQRNNLHGECNAVWVAEHLKQVLAA